jgi:hypothetical protein
VNTLVLFSNNAPTRCVLHARLVFGELVGPLGHCLGWLSAGAGGNVSFHFNSQRRNQDFSFGVGGAKVWIRVKPIFDRGQ